MENSSTNSMTSDDETNYKSITVNCKGCDKDFSIKSKINEKNTPNIFKSNCVECSIELKIIKCPKCEKLNSHIGTINNFTTINCRHCVKTFAVFVCPSKKCGKFIVTGTHYEGYLVTCNEEECKKEFTEVSCSKCERLLLFESLEPYQSEEREDCFILSRFIEGQVIECPYEDCQNVFTHMNCFGCFKSNKVEGKTVTNGESITCKYPECNKKVCKMFCLYCSRMLWYKEGIYHEGKKVTCPYTDCKKVFSAVKCPKCDRYNCYEGNSYLCGQSVTCVYKNCQYEFSKIDCAHCGKRTEMKEKSFRFGANNRCSCGSEFTHNVCICNHLMMVKVHYSEAQGIKCINEKCKRDVHNAYCPHCDTLLMLPRSSYRFGMTIECPNNNCAKKFNYLYCRRCGKGIYYKDNDYFEGKAIQCQDVLCREEYMMINCGFCSRGIQYTSRPNILSSELTCVYTDCKSNFYVSGIQKKVYLPKIAKFKKKGKFVVFVKPKKLELAEAKEEILEKIEAQLPVMLNNLSIENNFGHDNNIIV